MIYKANEFSSYDGKLTIASMHLKKSDEAMRVHEHDYPHDLFIVEGVVSVRIGEIVKTLESPSTVHFPTGAVHGFVAESDEALVVAVHESKYLGDKWQP